MGGEQKTRGELQQAFATNATLQGEQYARDRAVDAILKARQETDDAVAHLTEIAKIAALETLDAHDSITTSAKDSVERVTRLRREWEEMHEALGDIAIAAWGKSPPVGTTAGRVTDKARFEYARLGEEREKAREDCKAAHRGLEEIRVALLAAGCPPSMGWTSIIGTLAGKRDKAIEERDKLKAEIARRDGKPRIKYLRDGHGSYAAIIEREVGEVSMRYEYEAPTPEAVIDGLFAIVHRDEDEDRVDAQTECEEIKNQLAVEASAKHEARDRIDELDGALREIAAIAGDAIPESQVLIPDVVLHQVYAMARGEDGDGNRFRRLRQDCDEALAVLKEIDVLLHQSGAYRDTTDPRLVGGVLALAAQRDNLQSKLDATTGTALRAILESAGVVEHGEVFGYEAVRELVRQRDATQAIQADLAEIFDEHGTPMEEGCTLPGLLKNLFAAEHEQSDIANAEAREASDIHDALVEANIPVWEDGFSALDGIALLVKHNEAALLERDDARAQLAVVTDPDLTGTIHVPLHSKVVQSRRVVPAGKTQEDLQTILAERNAQLDRAEKERDELKAKLEKAEQKRGRAGSPGNGKAGILS